MISEREVFRFVRKWRKNTLEEVADYLGVSVAQVSLMERGRVEIMGNNRTKLLEFFRMDVERLNALRVIIFNLELYLNGEDQEDEDKAARGR